MDFRDALGSQPVQHHAHCLHILNPARNLFAITSYLQVPITISAHQFPFTPVVLPATTGITRFVPLYVTFDSHFFASCMPTSHISSSLFLYALMTSHVSLCDFCCHFPVSLV